MKNINIEFLFEIPVTFPAAMCLSSSSFQLC